MDLWIILYIIDWTLFALTAGTVLYLGIFAVAALFNKPQELKKAKLQRRFIVLIPSYKQDAVIEHTVMSILGQSYPQRMFDVIVISDHQKEMTNMRLAQYPITLLTPNFEESSKAKSLQYAILNLPEFKIYDVAIILDADNIVETEFLSTINDAYENASTKAIQLHRISRSAIQLLLVWMRYLRKSTIISSEKGILILGYLQHLPAQVSPMTSTGSRTI